MRPVIAGPGSSTSTYRPTHDKGVNAAHATQSDGFRPVAGPAKAAGSTSPRGNSANSGAAANGVKKCLHCGKTVYFAEEQLFDGQVFHISCFPIWSKAAEQKDLAPRNASYERSADVQPAYYRTGEATGEAHMESGSEYKHQAPNSGAPQAAGGPSKFCGQCGSKRDGSNKFCGNCGAKLE